MLAALIATRQTGLTVVPFVANGVLGAPYTFTLQAIGGVPPYAWAILSGSLPPGLTLDSSGLISGTPTLQGFSTFVVQVTDSLSATATGIITQAIWLYGHQFIAATTTFPCISFAKRAAVLTTDPLVSRALIFSSASYSAVRDSLERQYERIISQRSANEPTYLSNTILNTTPVVRQLRDILQTLPFVQTPDNVATVADMLNRTDFALFVMEQDLLVPPS